MGYTLRKEEGTKNPLGKNLKQGYRLYKDGKPVYPRFRNWFPNKREGYLRISKIKKEIRDSKRRKK